MKGLVLSSKSRMSGFYTEKNDQAMPSMNHSDDNVPVLATVRGSGRGARTSGYKGDPNGEIRRDGQCSPNVCGNEAACKPHSDNTYSCVCPHDNSRPTDELRCLYRNTVPITPHPIHNIIPPTPTGTNGTASGASNSTGTTQDPLSHNATDRPHLSTRRTLQPPTSVSPPLYAAVSDLRVLVSISAFCGLLFVLFVILCCWKRKQIVKCTGKQSKQTSSSCAPSPLVLKKSILVADRYTLNPQYTACSTTAPAPSVPLLRADTLRFLHEIGEGCFGKVFKGDLQREGDLYSDDRIEVVAVKVLKESASREAEEDFMREVDIMSAFRHPNILTLIGVVPRDTGMSPMMVFEYMPHGDLTEVLRSNARWCGSKRIPTPSVNTPFLDGKGLLSVALQIAAGMKYLAAQRFVHRDLACRNCLVSEGPVVKIADFGMSRDVYTCDYYKIGGSRLLPVRWMSPESVMYGRFTLESDIWSYGIVLWEIYSYGKQPYYGHTNEEVVKLILQGIMLIPPEDCPPLIYDLMRSCWKTEPRDRIRFPDIYDRLAKANENFQATEAAMNLSAVLEIEPVINKVNNLTLPRPPPIPIAQIDGILDPDGYLLPVESAKVNYLQTLPD